MIKYLVYALVFAQVASFLTICVTLSVREHPSYNKKWDKPLGVVFLIAVVILFLTIAVSLVGTPGPHPPHPMY